MKRLTIDIPESLHRAIKRRCAEQGIKIADVARELIGEWVRSDDPSTPKPDAAPAIRGYVYLLIDASGERFKIGRSIAPLMRIKQLPQEFDLATSRQVPVLGWRADKVEHLLHGLFRDHAVTMPPGDGCTEWFGIEAWDAVLVYAGDTGEKWGYFDAPLLAELGVDVDTHGKMPDVVLHYGERNWLLLCESVTSHGPVDGKRHAELAKLFAGSKAGLVYVTAFPSRAIMGRYLSEIAWETEVWVADAPSHLIHFNGERFLGPYPAD